MLLPPLDSRVAPLCGFCAACCQKGPHFMLCRKFFCPQLSSIFSFFELLEVEAKPLNLPERGFLACSSISVFTTIIDCKLKSRFGSGCLRGLFQHAAVFACVHLNSRNRKMLLSPLREKWNTSLLCVRFADTKTQTALTFHLPHWLRYWVAPTEMATVVSFTLLQDLASQKQTSKIISAHVAQLEDINEWLRHWAKTECKSFYVNYSLMYSLYFTHCQWFRLGWALLTIERFWFLVLIQVPNDSQFQFSLEAGSKKVYMR